MLRIKIDKGENESRSLELVAAGAEDEIIAEFAVLTEAFVKRVLATHDKGERKQAGAALLTVLSSAVLKATREAGGDGR